jgi:hypothetical protein
MKAKFEFNLEAGSEDHYDYAVYANAPTLLDVYNALRDLRRQYAKYYEADEIEISRVVKAMDEILDVHLPEELL